MVSDCRNRKCGEHYVERIGIRKASRNHGNKEHESQRKNKAGSISVTQNGFSRKPYSQEKNDREDKKKIHPCKRSYKNEQEIQDMHYRNSLAEIPVFSESGSSVHYKTSFFYSLLKAT